MSIGTVEHIDQLRRGRENHETALVARSPAMAKVLIQARTIAPLPGSILVLGESGTGKTRLCEEIHAASERASGPFHKKGCGEFDDGTLEATLFGHTRDAYTSARTDQAGLLMESHGGTLLLDDIDCLSLAGQQRLLRFLDDGVFYRLGEPGKPYRTNVRIIATTNQNLETLIRSGTFRQDLLFRLKRWLLRVPPLSERKEDVRELANRFLTEFQVRHPDSGSPGASFDDDVLTLFTLLRWSSNIRGLRMAVENIALFGVPRQGVYTLPDCARILFQGETPSGMDFGFGSSPLNSPDCIQRLLALTRWNKALTARIIDCSRTTLDKIIKQQGWREP